MLLGLFQLTLTYRFIWAFVYKLDRYFCFCQVWSISPKIKIKHPRKCCIKLSFSCMTEISTTQSFKISWGVKMYHIWDWLHDFSVGKENIYHAPYISPYIYTSHHPWRIGFFFPLKPKHSQNSYSHLNKYLYSTTLSS